MSKHVAEGTPTQVAHPARTVIRTAAAWVLAALAFLAVALPVVQETLGDVLPESWKGYLVSALAVVGALHLLVTRLMAIAQAQGLLAKLGLGTGVEDEARGEVIEDGGI